MDTSLVRNPVYRQLNQRLRAARAGCVSDRRGWGAYPPARNSGNRPDEPRRRIDD